MQTAKHQKVRGYSLAELLTIVGIIGVVSLVALPTFTQIIPQYRIRGAASEMSASLRMIRSKAVSTRSQWRMTVDPDEDLYWIEHEQVPNSGTWAPIGHDGKPYLAGGQLKRSLDVDLLPAGANIVVTFTRNGTIATASAIVVGVDNGFVRFNRYTINIAASGNVTVTPSKV